MSSSFKIKPLKKPVGKLMRTMQRDHLGVLYAIEKAIVEANREHADVDDSAVRAAVVAHLNDRDPDRCGEEVFNRLAAARRNRSDVPDEVWRDGLRVVLDSVKNHSDCQPGEVGYVEFARAFV